MVRAGLNRCLSSPHGAAGRQIQVKKPMWGKLSVQSIARAAAILAVGAGVALIGAAPARAVPPTPSITSPTSYSWLSTSTLTASGRGQASSSVELFVDWESRGKTTVSSSGTWSLSVSIADGDYLLNAKASDATGTSGLSSYVVARVDTIAPSAPAIVSPADGATATGGVVDLSGTAEKYATVEIFEDGGSRGTVAASDGTWARTLTGV